MTTINFFLYAINLAKTKVSQPVRFTSDIKKLHKISKLGNWYDNKEVKNFKKL